MPYAANFYVPDNIIGYTGVLNKNPTVYFLSSTHYGHITQVHGLWENVGREEVASTAEYTFGNIGDNNCLYELDPAANMEHPSRSPMVLVRAGAIPPELTHAIMVHPERKALRLNGPSVIRRANISRRKHPGQQPTEKERSAAREVIIFQWEKGVGTGVPRNTRLFTRCR